DDENKDDDDQEEGDDDDDQKEGNDDDQDYDEEGEEFIYPRLSIHDEEETKDEESFDLIAKTPKNSDNEGNDEENLGLNVGREERQDKEDDEDELYRDVNINLEGSVVQMADVHTTQEFEDSHVTLTLVNPDGTDSIFETSSQMDVQALTTVAPLPLSTPTLTPSTIATISTIPQVPTPSTTALSTLLPGVQETKRRKEARVNKRSKGESYQDHWQVYTKFETGADDRPITEPSQHPEWFSQQKKPPTPDSDWNKTLLATHESIRPGKSKLAKQTDSPSSFNELMDTLVDFLAFLMNRLKVDTLTPELLAGPTYELMKGSCKSLVELEFFLEEVYKATTGRRVIPFDHFINNDLKYLRGGASSRKYTNSVTKTKAADYGHIKWIEDLVPRIMESALDVYSKRRIIAVTELKIFKLSLKKGELDRINDKLYKFKEGDFKRLRIQDIEDMLLLLAQGKLTNLTVEERFAFNVSLRMFTRSIVIQRCVEDLQLRVESYQKNLNLTRPDTYHSDLKRKEAYIAYSNPRGFIYQNKDKQNRLMRIDELHKFSDGTLTHVRTTLDDRLKGIQMKYLPQTIWRKSDKETSASMIQAIDKQLKTRRIMRSLERSKSKNMGIVPTEMELILEHTQQGISHEVSVNPYGFAGYSNQTQTNDKGVPISSGNEGPTRYKVKIKVFSLLFKARTLSMNMMFLKQMDIKAVKQKLVSVVKSRSNKNQRKGPNANNKQKYGLLLKAVSYKDLYGRTMDEIIKMIGLKNNCTFCGVFHRQ
nr:cytoplasmic tRNA 2-thiolation protein 1 isoform X2 [Tanacetum cinerariifolium]